MPYRLIPRLDVDGPHLMKGVQLSSWRILGKPEAFSRHYAVSGATELCVVDWVARKGRESRLTDWIETLATETRMKVTLSGGLRDLGTMERALSTGVARVGLDAAALSNPDLIRIASQRFGTERVVVSIEARRHRAGHHEVHGEKGEPTGIQAAEWARRAADLGASELIVTSIDRDGTGAGYDIDLIASVTAAVRIPVIAGGGAGNAAHVRDVRARAQASGATVASLLHFETAGALMRMGDWTARGTLEFLERSGALRPFHLMSYGDLAGAVGAG